MPNPGTATKQAKPKQGGEGGGKRNIKTKTRTAAEKKERIWGHHPQKPYISSSLGDMARVMMRLACMENTYFYNAEPPPVEFYDYWQKFSVEAPKKPGEFVDKTKQSIPNLKKNTSSFNFYGRFTEKINTNTEAEDTGGDVKRPKKRIVTVDEKRISEIWKDVRISMSKESFISASTKISENASNVELENPWDEGCTDDYVSSESDFGFDIQDHHRHHRRPVPYWSLLTDSQTGQDENKQDSLEFTTPQGLIDKQANAITQSLVALQKKDNKLLVELASKSNPMDIIDHFADDLDDSFLNDSFSYTDLPDDAFGPEFDFLNEDILYKVKKKKKNQGGRRGSAPGEEEDLDDDQDDLDDDSSECLEENDELCLATKAKKRRKSKGKKSMISEASSNDTYNVEGGYKACIERRKKRIEDNLRAAVRCRSPMGSYRPPPGGEPLSKSFAISPGPAAYNPSLTATKPNIHSAIIVPRWKSNMNETVGPGPAHYVKPTRCTCEMLTLHETPRFTEDESIGPGPAKFNLSKYKGTAIDAPHALLLSRKNNYKNDMGGEFLNICGWTRYGRPNPPTAMVCSRHELKKKLDRGPGAYDPSAIRDTRVGIKLKSRIPKLGENDPSPGFDMVAGGIGEAGGFTFGIKNFMDRKDQSPGPIYDIEKFKPKPVSMTFKPFPMRDKGDEPSPIEWGIKPAEAYAKTLPRAPCPFLHGTHDYIGDKFKTPGPNHYDVCLECLDMCTEPGASLKGRYPMKESTSPGPADYTPIYPWAKVHPVVFQHRWKEPKKKKGDEAPRKKRGAPYHGVQAHRIPGGLILPRWIEPDEDEQVNPDFHNVFGMTNRGPKTSIPISLKSRHTPFKYSHIADPGQIKYNIEGACNKVEDTLE